MTTRSFPIASLILILGISSISPAQDGSGLEISAAVDITGSAGLSNPSTASDRLDIRGAELMVFGPIDPTFDGHLSLAAHPEGGASLFEVHEAHIGSSKLIPRSRFKLGQFFLGVGTLNQFHQHDWPFISAPYIHQHVFKSEEGALDSGGEFSILLPLPFYFEISLGLTNGFTYGHSHSSGNKPKTPVHYARVSSYASLGNFGIKPGLSYLLRTDQNHSKTTLTGIDITGKFRHGKTLVFLLMGEAWLRQEKPKDAEKEKTMGFYLYPQYGLNRTWSFGVRYDYFTNLNFETIEGKKIDNERQSIVPTLTFQNSEFAKFRIAYSHESILDPTQTKDQKSENRLLEFQTTFILGAHPAHDF